MDPVCTGLKSQKEVLLVYMQRMVPGRSFEAIGNLGCLTLASCLNQAGYRAKSITGITSDIRRRLLKEKDRLLAVCFYCDFDNQTAIRSLLSKLPDPPFYTLIGGPQTMHMHTDDAKSFGADAILCGDGEESLPAWLDAHTAKTPENAPAGGRIESGPTDAQDSGKKGRDQEAALPEELTSQKEGCYTLLTDFSPYPYPKEENSLDPKTGVFSVITARGCPHRCSFCFEGGNSKLLRPRPVTEVLQEIKARLQASPHLNYLFFADDTFTYDIRRLHEFTEGLKALREEFDFVWFCEGHASFFRRYPEALKEMVDAGLVRMQIGMESGNDGILKAYGKGITAEDIRFTATLAREAHLPQLAGNFIIGGALETQETMLQTREFMLSLMDEFPGLLDISTTFPIPLPGTRMVDDPASFQIIWDHPEYDCSIEDVPVNHTENLHNEEISRGRQQFLSAMLEKMRSLYAAGRIASADIRKNYELWIRYGITDTWGKSIFRADPVQTAYYSALIRYGLKQWSELSDEDRESAIATSVVKPEDCPNDEERSLLSLADGKSIAQIQIETGFSPKDLEQMMRRAETKHLLLFQP